MSFNRAELAQTLFEEAGDALFLFDPQTECIIDVNPMGLRLSGFSRREILTMQLTYLFRADDPRGPARLRNAFQKTGLFHSQDGYYLRNAKGAWIPVNLSVARLHAEPKTLAMITARDVREQRAARIQLEKAETALRRVLSSVSDFIWSAEWTAQGQWASLYYSPVVERVAGRPVAFFEQGFHRWLSIVHPDDRGRYDDWMNDLRNGVKRQAVEEYRILLPDGAVRWVRDSVMANPCTEGSGLRLDGVVADVTANRLAEEARRQSEERFQRVVETVADGLCIIDHAGRITFANAAAERILGLPRHEFIGRKYDDPQWQASRVDGEALQAEDFAFPRVMATRQPIHGIERAFARPDGRRIVVSFNASPLLDSTGKVVGMVSSLTDITERRRAEEALRESEDRYRQTFMHNQAIKLVIDPETGAIVDANPAAAAFYGYELEELKRMNIQAINVLPPATIAAEMDRARSQAKGCFEFPHRLASGEIRTVEVHSGPMQVQGRTLLFSIIHDVTERRLTEDALRQSEERFQHFMNNSPAIAFIKDANGRYVYGNKAWADQFQASSAELLGKTDFDLWPEETARMFQASDAQALATGSTLETTESSRTPDGKERCWLVFKFPLGGGDRPLLGGMVLDVSDRKRAQDQERMARQLLGAISHAQARFIDDEQPGRVFEGMLDDLMKLTDSARGYVGEVHWNSEGRPYLKTHAITGGPWGVTKRRPTDSPAPNGRHSDEVVSLLGEVLTTGKPKICNEFERDPHASGDSGVEPQLRSFLGLPIYHGGELVGVVGIANRPGGYDERLVEYLQPFLTTCASIIEACHGDRRRRLAEEALRASETKYRTLIDNLQQCVFLKDRNLRFVAANAQFCRFTNVPEEELIGSSDFDFYPRELAEKYRADDLRVLNGERLELEEANLANGRMLAVRVVKTPVRDSSGQITGVLGIFWDVTEQRQLEAQLQQSQKMEAIGQLAGGVAHDFNNLLQAILGNLALVVPSLTPEDPNRILLQSAERASQRAAELVRQLLGFSRRSILRLEPVDLNLSVQETIGLLERTIDPRITIEHRAAPQLWSVHADHGQMNQVLMNLCLNARDAMPDGGNLSIETQNVVISEDYVRKHLSARTGEFVRLTVRDTGHGMPPEIRSRVFEPFFTTKSKEKGTGLGLAMVLGIVEQHQGWITCQSEPRLGTEFQIHLPRHVPIVTECETVVKPHRDAGRGSETILFVDDEAVVRTLGKTILQRFGYHVLLAEDGFEALETYRLQSDQIDLVVLDMTMPRLSGQDTLQELLKLDPDARVILTSGYSAEPPAPNFHGQAAGFIGKPYRPDELSKIVRQVLDERPRRPSLVTVARNGQCH